MKEPLSPADIIILETVGRTRGLTVETALAYRLLKAMGNAEALRKRMERLCEKGFLAHSKLPNGLRVFRLTHKSVPLMNAPKAYASSPTAGIAVEMLSVASFAAKADEFVFPTSQEADAVFSELVGAPTSLKVPGRFALRFSKSATDAAQSEVQIHYWLAEPPKPADKIAKRVQVVFEKLRQTKLVADLIELGLFGFTVVVPSEGVRATLKTYRFPVQTEVVVLSMLQTFVSPGK